MIADQKSTIQYFLVKVIYWLVGASAAAFFISSLLTKPNQTLIGLGLFIFLLLTIKNQRFGVYIILLLPLAGELIRLPLGPENGILITDAVIPFFIFGWIIKNIIHKQPLPKATLTIPLLLFVTAATLSLIQSLIFLSTPEVMSGSLYLIRFLQYGFLYFIVLQTVQTPQQVKTALKVLTLSTFLLALVGFIQLAIYPNLTALEEYGYDPHINRLVSTWLDPNFVGGALAFVISILLGITLHTKKRKHSIGLLCIMTFLGIALFLTFSRSAYLALIAGVFLISLLQSRKILILAILLFSLGLTASPRAQERVGELTQSVTSLIFNSVDTPDPTAKLRLESWNQTWQIIQKRPLIGSGYNNLRAVNYQEGFIKDPNTHSGSGSDSSLLTILATTGILGFIPFLLLYLIPLKTAFRTWRNKKFPNFSRGYSLGIVGGIATLFIHSIFVNSLLFPQILIFFWVSIGLLEILSKEKSDTENQKCRKENHHSTDESHSEQYPKHSSVH